MLAALISLRLFQTYTRSQSVQELQREASGLSQLYADAALRAADEGSGAIDFAASKLELATGDRIYYVGASLFPGQDSGLTRLAASSVPSAVTALKGPVTFEFTPPGTNRSYLAAANPVRLEPESDALGAIIVAKPRTELRDQWLPLVLRLAAAVGVGAVLAGLLSWWLSRKITGPVLALSSAADEIASGNYAVRVPAGGGGDEISHLSERFNEMAARLAATEERERQFLMSVSHELRTPLTAIKGHVDAIRDGLFDDPELERASLDVSRPRRAGWSGSSATCSTWPSWMRTGSPCSLEEVDMGASSSRRTRASARRRGDEESPSISTTTRPRRRSSPMATGSCR